MPYSYAVYTGNGSTTQFNVSFPYIRREHVFASIDYVSASFTWINNTTIQISPAPGNGTRVEVRRVTPVNVPLVDFADGSTLVAADLDTNALQQTYINQEQDDQFQDSVFINAQGLLDAGAKRLTNLGNPASAQDATTKGYVDGLIVAAALADNNYGDVTLTSSASVWTINNSAITSAKLADSAVTSAKIADGAIVNADVNDSAAIAGTKISPNFGSQNVATTGTVTATSFVGSGASLTGITPFPSGTVMLFVQTSAPTGWTKSTTHNDKALRVVSGAASSGGSTAFTTVFASRTPAGTVGNTTLSISQIPSHNHGITTNYSFNSGGGVTSSDNSASYHSSSTDSAGGGGSHNHSFTGTAMDFAVQYVDVIIATKD